MELRHLRYFIAVALEENVTRAAQKLHVSQPALSRQIRDLEEELGFELLERSAKSVSLTEAGRVFLDEASAVLERLEAGIKTAKASAACGSAEIRVGYAPSLTARILPPTIRAFQAQWPKVKIKLRDLSSEEMVAGLKDGSLDFALQAERTGASLPGLVFRPMKDERVLLAVSPAHALSQSKSVAVEALSKEKLVGYDLDEYPEYGAMIAKTFAASRKKLRLAESHGDVSSLIAAVEAGIGVALVTESIQCVSGDRLRLIPLVPEPDPLVIGIAWLDRKLNARDASFLETAVAICSRELEREKPSILLRNRA